MALSGRIRSGISTLNKLGYLRSHSLSSQTSTLHRALAAPTLTNSEVSRNYATSSGQKEQKHKLPLALYGGSGNYASALYLASVKSNSLEKVEAELLDLVEATKKSPAFSQFTKDLSVPADTRVKAIQEINSEAKFSDVTKRFLVVLAENGRLRHIDSIAKRFLELTMAYKGIVKAIVTTVIPLPPEEEKELKETLQDIIGQGKKVNLEQKIDPSILGGLVVEFSQKVFDMSIRTRARQMERFLRDPANLANL
ncbi:ATP synthase subunit O, mitochondrial [Quillaja saponaria]|uniref:ATP synthase subunit O, mitochondrial n=1 Tax=Quillaja saponaria TaxID=32244 RepID=A0AAD7L0E6_QUISA|nr:ATP synthase subunit O, mitochondrial [Quillaja saponaria]